MSALPTLFFRVRDTGALVFRVTDDARTRRLEMDPVAVVHLGRDEIRPQGDRELTHSETEEIRRWMARRRTLQALRDIDDIHRTVDQLNATAHWAQTRADAAHLAEVTDQLLMAMHDLRTVLLRRKGESLTQEDRGA